MKFIAQGTILSKVECHHERKVRAELLNKPLEEVPLTFGSLRMGVNVIALYNSNNNISNIYNVDKYSNEKDIKEERLILEISFKYNKEGSIIEEHKVVEELIKGEQFELVMDSAFISKKHNLKLINTSSNGIIKSYFMKSWADKINYFTIPELEKATELITPKEMVQKISLDKELIIA